MSWVAWVYWVVQSQIYGQLGICWAAQNLLWSSVCSFYLVAEVPAPDYPYYIVVRYLSPIGFNPQSYGIEARCHPGAWRAMQKVCDTTDLLQAGRGGQHPPFMDSCVYLIFTNMSDLQAAKSGEMHLTGMWVLFMLLPAVHSSDLSVHERGRRDNDMPHHFSIRQ